MVGESYICPADILSVCVCVRVRVWVCVGVCGGERGGGGGSGMVGRVFVHSPKGHLDLSYETNGRNLAQMSHALARAQLALYLMCGCLHTNTEPHTHTCTCTHSDIHSVYITHTPGVSTNVLLNISLAWLQVMAVSGK